MQNPRQQHTQKDRNRRYGLAPLELVLALPIMLFVMALMVNFGNIAAWKIRAQSNTRYAGARTLRDRTGNFDPNPQTWPDPATLAGSGGPALNDVNRIWDRHPDLITPVTRGPVITETDQGRSIVVPGRFLMHEEVHAGDGRVRRKLPLLRGILPDDGTYGYDEHQEFLDNRWEYRHLKMPNNPYDRGDVKGDSGNMRRRAKRWYRLDPEFFGKISTEVSNLRQADRQLKTNPSRFNLDPLDRDSDFYIIGLRRQLGLVDGPVPSPIPEGTRIYIPDFHPRARISCELDALRVQLGIVNPLTRRIERLPGRMARSFISLYRGEIARLEAFEPPPQAAIDHWKRLLEQVQRFYDSLPRRNQ